MIKGDRVCRRGLRVDKKLRFFILIYRSCQEWKIEKTGEISLTLAQFCLERSKAAKKVIKPNQILPSSSAVTTLDATRVGSLE